MNNTRALVHEQRGEIIRRWCDGAAQFSWADDLNADDVVSKLPALLMAFCEETTAPRALRDHVELRMQQGLRASDVRAELALLVRCALQATLTTPGHEQLVDDLFVWLSAGCDTASEMFRARARLEEEADARVLHAMAHAAQEAAAQDANVDVLFDGLLPFVMNATHATCAAWRVQDRSSQTLIYEGSLGAAGATLLREMRDFHELQDAKDSSSSSSTTATATATSCELHTSADLWQLGVHALGGARVRHQAVASALVMGMADARALTHRELRRIAVLAEWINLLADGAVCRARSNDQIDRLRTEAATRRRLTSVVGHNVRGPLSAARLCAEVLRTTSTELSADRARFVARIERALERCERVIEDLSDINALHADASPPRALASADLDALCQSVVAELDASQAGRIIVGGAVTDPIVHPLCSAPQLRRALCHLVVNALRFAERGSGVTIAPARANGFFELSVFNVGTPMETHDLELLLQTPSRWGLGFHIAHACAGAHGGNVVVTSDASGTTFTLRLPMSASASASASTSASATPVLSDTAAVILGRASTPTAT